MVNILDNICGHRGAFKILRLLITTKSGYTGREIGKMVGLSHQTVHSILGTFTDDGLVVADKVGRAYCYKINRDHLLIGALTALLNAVTRWREIVGETLLGELPTKPLSIIIYGSCARGEETGTSDIDVLFLYPDDVSKTKVMDEITAASEKIVHVSGHSMSPKISGVTEFKSALKKKEQLITRIVDEGIAIAGLGISEMLGHDSKKDQER